MPERRVLILCPLAHEARPIRAAFRGSPSARVVVCGPGPAAVRRTLQSQLHQDPALSSLLVILAGVAGGLAPTDPVPTVTHVVDSRSSRMTVPFPAPAGGPVALLGLDEPACTPAEKRRWRDATGAAVVDTESHALAALAAEHRFSWSVVRGISDGPDETLPPQVTHWVSQTGATRPFRTFLDLLLTPTLLPAVAALARRSARLLPEVARVTRATAQAWLEHRPSQAPAGVPEAPTTPLPVPAGTPLVIIVGGTFDPPHRAHIELPLAARRELERIHACPGEAWLVYIPAQRSPHKTEGPSASDADRAAMLRAALEHHPRTAVWTDETDRATASSPSYTVDTLRRARRWLDERGAQSTRLRLLIGADQAIAFNRWREPRVLLGLAEPAVMLRPPTTSPTELLDALRATGAWSEEDLRKWGDTILHTHTLDAAATSVRAQLAAHTPPGELANLLPPEVISYITAHNLYTARAQGHDGP